MRAKTIRQLWGREFEVVKEGLDESQVEGFVAELVGERDMLVERQEHLLSLTKLAEKTVAEADRLAEDIKREAEKEGRTKADKILAKAEQEAQETMEQKRQEILAATDSEAATIIANAQKEVERLVKQHKQRVQEEIKEAAQKLHNQLVSGLKEVMEQAMALQVEWESKLSDSVIDSLPSDDELPSVSVPPTVEQGEKTTSPTMEQNEETAPPAVEQSEEIVPPTTLEADLEYKCDVMEQLQQAWVDTNAAAGSEEQPPTDPSEISRQPDIEKVDGAVMASDEKVVPSTYEGTVELDILPPLTPGQLMEIQRYLRDWPGVAITELRPNNDGYSITAILDKPIQLIDILKQLPEVEDARECTADKAGTLGDVAPGKNGLRKIAITVSSNT